MLSLGLGLRPQNVGLALGGCDLGLENCGLGLENTYVSEMQFYSVKIPSNELDQCAQ